MVPLGWWLVASEVGVVGVAVVWLPVLAGFPRLVGLGWCCSWLGRLVGLGLLQWLWVALVWQLLGVL